MKTAGEIQEQLYHADESIELALDLIDPDVPDEDGRRPWDMEGMRVRLPSARRLLESARWELADLCLLSEQAK
jgi:hypothetical protein